MNIKRFNAPTSREALAKARMAFGDGTLILSNRPTANGVEVVATAEDTLSALDGSNGSSASSSHPPLLAPTQARGIPSRESQAKVMAPLVRNPIEEDTEQLAMSTLSFQDYVRERMLRRRHEALNGPAEPQTLSERSRDQEPERERMPAPAVVRHNPLRTIPVDLPPEPPRRRQEASTSHLAQASNQQSVMSELHAMKDLIEDRFNTLAWLGQARQNPIQSNLMLKMIRAGYSPALARAVLERMPEELSAGESVRWLMEVLERNLKTDLADPPLYEQGGIFAMVGSTGVGKTTTTAKLAAMCARVHGPGSVGLITLDTYRVGAHEQLRTYGRMLGIVAHLAHDRAALQDLLGLLSGKKMVLIDTTGVAPRDPRKRDMLDVLDLPNVNRLLVLNAGCHGDTLDDVLTAFKTAGSQQAILSKVDEAVKLGPAIDALIRHQMVLRGVTNGQRVPEDWERADAHKLISTSMRAPAKSAFDPKAVDLNFFFSHSPDTMNERGLVDA
ncbi:MAG: flagellar biosynthesis protein FlhF [Gammaproteobacteria bacterium]|jgi:flagellar biosynthesis protein FlhF|nr:flagellar biosynthesis protein FlhF [Gammaproteobacteria bacterium]MBU1354891.1 flagellar biosynthesis protein FlhF [Gammaproteobacteria bacterium]MBU1506754.1 flagellar biosynthesis protein FlhF [Gammaproteobacteria bacterium]MBU2120634.1 flagellar biosynthesis protein FlhF [Gammaproteobacteria bacterium]MBU2168982.1 flagellar biosynthesis protein FlhF [Gammaproteobacteria bacterium]